MAKFYRITPITESEFYYMTLTEFICGQLAVPIGNEVYIGLDECEEYNIDVPLDIFEGGE